MMCLGIAGAGASTGIVVAVGRRWRQELIISWSVAGGHRIDGAGIAGLGSHVKPCALSFFLSATS